MSHSCHSRRRARSPKGDCHLQRDVAIRKNAEVLLPRAAPSDFDGMGPLFWECSTCGTKPANDQQAQVTLGVTHHCRRSLYSRDKRWVVGHSKVSSEPQQHGVEWRAHAA